MVLGKKNMALENRPQEAPLGGGGFPLPFTLPPVAHGADGKLGDHSY